MFFKVARFEFDFQRSSPVFWVTAILFFLLVFGGMTIEAIQVGSGGNVNANSPSSISMQSLVWTLFFMFASTAFVANTVVRDDETGFGPILRSTRIAKRDYIFGRFTGAFAAVSLVFAVVPLAISLGSLMPWLDQETLGPNRLADYAFAYFLLALPTIFATSAIFFALATMTRSMMWTYLGIIAFFILYSVGTSLSASQPEMETALAYADPFGLTAYALATEYWTAAELNAGNPPLGGVLLANRVIWVGIGLAFLGLAYGLYGFADKGVSSRRQKKRELTEAATPSQSVPARVAAPPPVASFGRETALAQLATRTRFEMRQIFRSPAYLMLLLLGAGLTFITVQAGGEIYGTPSLLRTVLVLPLLTAAFGVISTIIAIYYTGELVWRERERKIHEVIDATPMPNWAYVVPKTIGVILVLLSTLAVGALVAIAIQLSRGYTDIVLMDYVVWFLLPSGVNVSLVAVLSIFVQSLSPSKYAGWGIMVLYVVFSIVLSSLGFEHVLYDYGGGSIAPISDMNGSGGFMAAGWWARLYWSGFSLVMLVAAHLLWRRGTEQRLKPRLKRLPRSLLSTSGAVALAGFLVATGAGAYIYHNTNVLNDYQTTEERDLYFANYEKKYLQYEELPQPSPTQVTLDVGLYPLETRAEITGRYTLTNLTDTSISQVHVRNTDPDLEILEVALEGASLASYDEEFGYRIYRLNRPMAPGDTRQLSFRTQRWQQGFRNRGFDTRLVRNGTFLTNFQIAPAIGMDQRSLLQDRSKRRKYDLPAELRPAKLEDLSATDQNYVGSWTTADITVSTIASQTPIAPGQKLSDVIRDGRRIARFQSEAPIINFFSIQSADYAERHREHDGIDLTVYYHAPHDRNIDRMLDTLETSLDYYQANFGPYQFEQVRIIEFPGYQTFAQAFANTIPYSETFGFTGDFSDPEDIDYATYVTAHELAHQYWGHQVAGAAMQGGTLLSETLSEYSALMVMKQIYGEDQIRRFLKYALDEYLGSRGGEIIEELPLNRVEHQRYVHYEKGALAMYLLQERLGEDAVNRALSRLLERFKFQGAPYPRSVDLIRELRAVADTPQEQALITDLFERITIYDLKVDEPTAARRADGRWDVTVPVVAQKFYADGQGSEKETPLAEPIEIGLFTAEPGRGAFDKGNVLLMEVRPVRSGRQVLRFVTDQKPTHAGVDPYNFYIDRKSDDNVAAVAVN